MDWLIVRLVRWLIDRLIDRLRFPLATCLIEWKWRNLNVIWWTCDFWPLKGRLMDGLIGQSIFWLIIWMIVWLIFSFWSFRFVIRLFDWCDAAVEYVINPRFSIPQHKAVLGPLFHWYGLFLCITDWLIDWLTVCLTSCSKVINTMPWNITVDRIKLVERNLTIAYSFINHQSNKQANNQTTGRLAIWSLIVWSIVWLFVCIAHSYPQQTRSSESINARIVHNHLPMKRSWYPIIICVKSNWLLHRNRS